MTGTYGDALTISVQGLIVDSVTVGNEVRSRLLSRGIQPHRLPRVLVLSPHDTASTPYLPFAELLAERLAGEGLHVTLKVLNPLNYTNGHKTLLTKLRHFGADQYGAFRSLRELIAQHDIVHLFTSPASDFAESGLHALILAKYFGKSCVLTLVGGNVEDATNRLAGYMVPLLRLANKVVVQSEFAARHLSHHRLPVTVVHAPASDPAADAKPITSVQPKMLTILSAGPASNTSTLLRAYGRVKQKYPRAELTVVGPERIIKQFRSSVPADNGIHLTSDYKRDELSRLWHEADLYVNPSSDDDCPYGVLQALGHGLPIVTADAPGMSSLIQDHATGLVFPANDFIALADRVIELTEQPDLVSSLSQSACAKAQQYAWPQTRQSWLSVYMPR